MVDSKAYLGIRYSMIVEKSTKLSFYTHIHKHSCKKENMNSQLKKTLNSVKINTNSTLFATKKYFFHLKVIISPPKV